MKSPLITPPTLPDPAAGSALSTVSATAPMAVDSAGAEVHDEVKGKAEAPAATSTVDTAPLFASPKVVVRIVKQSDTPATPQLGECDEMWS